MINLGTSIMQDFALGGNLVERIDLGVTTIFDPYTTLTGTLPFSFNSRVAGGLKNYRVFGTAAGAGIETINLLDVNAKDTSNGYVSNAYLTYQGGETASDNYDISEYIPVLAETDYSIIARQVNSPSFCFYDASKQFMSGGRYANNRPRNFTTPQGAAFLRMTITRFGSNVSPRDMLLLGNYSTQPDFEAYGYKIPLANTSGQNTDSYPLFIGNTKLGATEYLDFSEQKIYKDVSGILTPTDPPAPFPAISAYQGKNTLSDPMVQTKAYSLEQGNYGGDPGGQLFKHNSSHNYYNKAIRVPSILTVPAGQKWLIATKIGWATTVRIANSSGIVTSITGTNGTTTDPIVIEASTSERKLGIHTSHLVDGSVVTCVPSDYGGDLDITVVDAGALGSMMIKGRISAS